MLLLPHKHIISFIRFVFGHTHTCSHTHGTIFPVEIFHHHHHQRSNNEYLNWCNNRLNNFINISNWTIPMCIFHLKCRPLPHIARWMIEWMDGELFDFITQFINCYSITQFFIGKSFQFFETISIWASICIDVTHYLLPECECWKQLK